MVVRPLLQIRVLEKFGKTSPGFKLSNNSKRLASLYKLLKLNTFEYFISLDDSCCLIGMLDMFYSVMFVYLCRIYLCLYIYI